MTIQLKEIDPPGGMQETMNKVVKSQNANFAILTGSDIVNVIGKMQAALLLNGKIQRLLLPGF